MKRPAHVGEGKGSLEKFSNEGIVLAVGRMDQEVKAATNCKPELAFREKEFGKRAGVH
jgi:hypothetical protein